ncbi:MAG: hypothetical protein KJ787_00570 [Gammaproteobacteria bacterium]|nr:hypothetical protein [Gammaproteobacteria bacterium]MBU1644809.1 hypothetical protein [Gammaproteobacteria bacterium]MBU1973042.1 hypothetical protein [Gammaproteobacteria bacterium]
MQRATIEINGKPVQVEWSAAAARELEQRQAPLFVELELYFSCLVKKFVHFREDSRGYETVAASDKLQLYFRPVTSTACTWEVAERLGRQPEMEIDSVALRQVAPKRVRIDFVKGSWAGSYNFCSD